MTSIARTTILFIITLMTAPSFAQMSGKDIIADNEVFRLKINEEYADSTKSPLPNDERLVFDGLPFFPIDTNFCVTAKFERAKRSKTFKMKTTTDRKPVYEVYGTAVFSLNSKEYELSIYQSVRLREMEEFKEYLFLPFNDLSNGEQSYGGGRFIDLKVLTGDTIVIDFNQAYNPYCAYSQRFSCPIPPRGNFLKVEVLAGVKNPH
jgi:uncharacterized protein (DUF1684 family)